MGDAAGVWDFKKKERPVSVAQLIGALSPTPKVVGLIPVVVCSGGN